MKHVEWTELDKETNEFLGNFIELNKEVAWISSNHVGLLCVFY